MWCSPGASGTISAARSLGQPVLVGRVIGEQHLGDAGDLAAAVGDRRGSLAPATSTWTSPPIAAAAVTRIERGAACSAWLSCSATTRTVISDHPRFVLQLVDQFGDRRDLDAGLALRRLLDLEGRQARRRRRRRVAPGVSSSIGFFLAFMMFGSDA